MSDCDFGLIGLAVMGENLALNVESRGYRVAVHNRSTDRVDAFIRGRAAGRNFKGCHSVAELVAAVKRPRKLMMLVKAGPAVDQLIEQMRPHLSPGDIVIDGGNTHYTDTERRTKAVEDMGMLYVGCGVSGGEEGALKGPSLMPGGSAAAWPHIREMFQAIAAKVGPNNDIPCCEWVGPRGAGHYVKMVHNGIEYGDMQLICEAYHLLQERGPRQRGALRCLRRVEPRRAAELPDRDHPRHLQRPRRPDRRLPRRPDPRRRRGEGHGQVDEPARARPWRSQHAGDDGRVRARPVGPEGSARRASQLGARQGPTRGKSLRRDRAQFVEAVRQALYASKIISYAQGFVQLQEASREHGWGLDYGDCALLWRGGCIIRAQFLDRIKEAFDASADLENLLLAPYFRDAVTKAQPAWRAVVAAANVAGVPVPAFATALAYYDGYRRERLPANLLQAQRDYFGAHTFERTDGPGAFHAEWLERRRPPAP